MTVCRKTMAVALCVLGALAPPSRAQTAKPKETPKPAKAAPDAAARPKAAVTAEASDFARKPWTGDLDGMIKRRIIRVLVPYNRTHYFIDKGVQRGLAYEMGVKFEEALNAKLKTGNIRVHVVFVPVSRDQLLSDLVDGKGDIAAASLTITPERQKLVDFGEPTFTDVSEIVVTGPRSPTIATLDDLAGQEVFVRKSSSYYESLAAQNQRFKSAGKKEIVLKEAPETLEDEDLLEMVNAGLVKAIVVDSYKATFWKQVFPDIVLHPDVAVRTGGQIAVAFRKDSPKLKAELDAFVKKNRAGSAFGNILLQRYLKSTKYAKSATADADMKRFQSVVQLFRRYSDQYDLDFLLMLAQGYQESRLDQTVKSQVGAVGVMQVMPATGNDMKVGDIQQIEPNIHAGVKYIRFMIDQYFKDEPMDRLNKGLFAFASYNCGPNRVRQLRAEAKRRGLDPNVWFNNVERVASERIGRETVQYVSNIFKYYVAYSLAVQEMDEKAKAKGGS
jgi:membrane-bound lytic murein transglycosylase MltF